MARFASKECPPYALATIDMSNVSIQTGVDPMNRPICMEFVNGVALVPKDGFVMKNRYLATTSSFRILLGQTTAIDIPPAIHFDIRDSRKDILVHVGDKTIAPLLSSVFWIWKGTARIFSNRSDDIHVNGRPTREYTLCSSTGKSINFY
jgi:hypothetical protein